MHDVYCCTSASLAYLDRARVMAETVKRHHPTWAVWLFLNDREPPNFQLGAGDELFDRVVSIDELAVPDREAWIFSHNVVELCTAVKGMMLNRLFREGAKKIIYLDPDIAVFDSLERVGALLDEHPIVLTPHLTQPENTPFGVADNEIGCLKHGVYNLGFIAVRACDEGKRFAQWWCERLLEYCYEDIPAGLFTDQRWCDLIPCFFPNTYILRDPGYNVACWNLSNRPIKMHANGDISAGTHALRFFHFTKINTVGEMVLERYSNGRCEVFELLRWYRERLKSHQVEELPPRWWAFGYYQNGAPIPDTHRVAYRRSSALQSQYPDPFRSGPDTFQAWCSMHLA